MNYYTEGYIQTIEVGNCGYQSFTIEPTSAFIVEPSECSKGIIFIRNDKGIQYVCIPFSKLKFKVTGCANTVNCPHTCNLQKAVLTAKIHHLRVRIDVSGDIPMPNGVQTELSCTGITLL